MNSQAGIDAIIQNAQTLWQKGDTDAALEQLRAAYQDHSHHVALAFEYGHLLGQISFGKSSAADTARRNEALEVLGRLCQDLEALPPDEQWKIRRHYYLYSGQHLMNRALGYEEIQRGNRLGLHSVGFGCLHHAMELAEADRVHDAQGWAREGQKALAELLAIDTPKYGRHLAHALTLALLGQKQEAMDATHKAAALLGVPPDSLTEHGEAMARLLRYAACGEGLD